MSLFVKCFLVGALTVSSALCASGTIEVRTDEAPKAIGPYSQAVQAGQYLFVSGQLAIDPASNRLIGTTIEEQTIVDPEIKQKTLKIKLVLTHLFERIRGYKSH